MIKVEIATRTAAGTVETRVVEVETTLGYEALVMGLEENEWILDEWDY